MPKDYTPGPWIVESHPEGAHKIRHAGRYGHSVVALVPPAEGWSLLHQDANAALIAAAPDLLEAIQIIAFSDISNARATVLAAIAKAEGR